MSLANFHGLITDFASGEGIKVADASVGPRSMRPAIFSPCSMPATPRWAH